MAWAFFLQALSMCPGFLQYLHSSFLAKQVDGLWFPPHLKQGESAGSVRFVLVLGAYPIWYTGGGACTGSAFCVSMLWLELPNRSESFSAASAEAAIFSAEE